MFDTHIFFFGPIYKKNKNKKTASGTHTPENNVNIWIFRWERGKKVQQIKKKNTRNSDNMDMKTNKEQFMLRMIIMFFIHTFYHQKQKVLTFEFHLFPWSISNFIFPWRFYFVCFWGLVRVAGSVLKSSDRLHWPRRFAVAAFALGHHTFCYPWGFVCCDRFKYSGRGRESRP